MNQSLGDGYWREFPIQSRRSGIRKVKSYFASLRNRTADGLPLGARGIYAPSQIKGLRGGVHLVRRTSDPADLSASGGLVRLGLVDPRGIGFAFHGAGANLPASGRDCGKWPFMDGN